MCYQKYNCQKRTESNPQCNSFMHLQTPHFILINREFQSQIATKRLSAFITLDHDPIPFATWLYTPPPSSRVLPNRPYPVTLPLCWDFYFNMFDYISVEVIYSPWSVYPYRNDTQKCPEEKPSENVRTVACILDYCTPLYLLPISVIPPRLLLLIDRWSLSLLLPLNGPPTIWANL